MSKLPYPGVVGGDGGRAAVRELQVQLEQKPLGHAGLAGVAANALRRDKELAPTGTPTGALTGAGAARVLRGTERGRM